jgi:hypothetical protein
MSMAVWYSNGVSVMPPWWRRREKRFQDWIWLDMKWIEPVFWSTHVPSLFVFIPRLTNHTASIRDFSWLSRAQVRYLPRWCVQIFIVTWYRTYRTRSCTYVYPWSVQANCIRSVCNYWLVPSIIDDAVTAAVALNRTPGRLTTNGAFKLWFRDGSIPDSARVSRSLRLYEMQTWQVGNLFGLATCTCRAANKNWRHWPS